MNRIVCWFFNHKWETFTQIALKKGPSGHGALTLERCSRCNAQRYVFKADVNVGQPVDNECTCVASPSETRMLTCTEDEVNHAKKNTEEKATNRKQRKDKTNKGTDTAQSEASQAPKHRAAAKAGRK